MNPGDSNPDRQAAVRGSYLLANVLVLAVLVYAWLLEVHWPDFYYMSIQEDEYIEWASFWAFLLAAVAAIVASRKQVAGRFPWFLYGLALFCFFVAMEEISWGQRVLGYRPPVYFLEHNFQQEFNFHNVIDTDYRKLALSATIVGYGVLLPLLALVAPLRGIFDRIGIVVPPLGLLPLFAATFLMYLVYPFSHSGEWVELMLGLGMLFALMPPEVKPVLLGWTVVMALGIASGALTRLQRDDQPEMLEAAQAEIGAIKRDFESGRAWARCNVHKRLYSYVVKYEQFGLQQGEFASLVSQGMPEERAEFLLDPWNSPYWIRYRCDRKTQTQALFVYSFGPNRRRESSETEIRGDDVGAYIYVNQ
ncbi:MAG: hypothetical protein QNI96_11360 [Woeseiaceae bacterium]|nr:hypothetical protein [Woeseiaceae bacterium]